MVWRVLGMTYTTAFAEDHVPPPGPFDPYMHVFLDAVAATWWPSSNCPTARWAAIRHAGLGAAPGLRGGGRSRAAGGQGHIEAQGIDVLGPTWHGIFKSIYFFDPNGHRLELACNIGTPEQYAELKTLAPACSRNGAGRSAPRAMPPGCMRSRRTHEHRPHAQSAGIELGAGGGRPCRIPGPEPAAGHLLDRWRPARAGTAIGDCAGPCRHGGTGPAAAGRGAGIGQATLNALFALPAADRLALRHALFACLTSERFRVRLGPLLHRAEDCALHLPSASATTPISTSAFITPPTSASCSGPTIRCCPTTHVPIGYHGRASSVRVSGTTLVRPKGQLKAPDAEAPVFAPSRRLDYELELGCGSRATTRWANRCPSPMRGAGSAGCACSTTGRRAISRRGSTSRSGRSSPRTSSPRSPRVVTAEALAPFRVAQQPGRKVIRSRCPTWSMRGRRSGALALDLEVTLASAAMRDAGLSPLRLSHGPATNMYWTVAQMVAHHTSNGCDLHAGDLLGTGTISGPARDSFGSLMELSGGGREPVTLPGGETRCFLEDGDQLTLSRGRCATGSARSASVPAPAPSSRRDDAATPRLLALHRQLPRADRAGAERRGHEQVTHDLRTGAQRAPAFLALNPQGLVPALELDGERRTKPPLTQSPAILEWLDEAYPQTPLLPGDALGRATVRAMAGLVCCDIHRSTTCACCKRCGRTFRQARRKSRRGSRAGSARASTRWRF
jgi:fumarylacetoacetase